MIRRLEDGTWLADFGKVAFGNLELDLAGQTGASLEIHFGEAQRGDRIDRTPPGSVRYAAAKIGPTNKAKVVAAPLPDVRNTTPPAVLTPADWGVLVPFRWIEIVGWNGELRLEQIRRRAAFDATWDDRAAHFASSHALLNRVWELCHYSIKATTFAGVFVDGDRERIPYEADAYLNQLSYYAANPDPAMTRDTFDYLIAYPTWPTEWAPHMIFMAHADWMHTADRQRLAACWGALKPKLQFERVGPDGLLTSTAEQRSRADLVDWPKGERDGYEFCEVNTVVNAFHLRAVALMADLAKALGRETEATEYRERYVRTRRAFQEKLFDPARGLFRDGVGSEHASLHANLFPLAFGLAPEGREKPIADWLLQRGMACSVYAAQYLMEALFIHGNPDGAFDLMLAEGDRSWRHMVESGTTITWEAWDQRYKPNQDWNHAWGAAPANLLPRFLLGVSPVQPGWSQVQIRPFAGKQLEWCKGTVPTPRGPISVEWSGKGHFELSLSLPAGVVACVEIPARESSVQVFVDEQLTPVERAGDYWRIARPLSDKCRIVVRAKETAPGS